MARLDPYDNSQYVKDCSYDTFDGKSFRIASICNQKGECDANQHREARCIETSKGITWNKHWGFRKANTPFKHKCNIPPKDRQFVVPPSAAEKEKVISDLKRRYHKLITHTGMSYVAATSDAFYHFFYAALKEFKKSGCAEPEDFWKRIERHELSEEMREDGKQFKVDFLQALVGMFGSFSVDAYTLDHHHYIAGLACFPQLSIRPLLLYLEEASNEQEAYAEVGAFFHRLCMFAVSFYVQ
jgi:hypothetical protein